MPSDYCKCWSSADSRDCSEGGSIERVGLMTGVGDYGRRSSADVDRQFSRRSRPVSNLWQAVSSSRGVASGHTMLWQSSDADIRREARRQRKKRIRPHDQASVVSQVRKGKLSPAAIYLYDRSSTTVSLVIFSLVKTAHVNKIRRSRFIRALGSSDNRTRPGQLRSSGHSVRGMRHRGIGRRGIAIRA